MRSVVGLVLIGRWATPLLNRLFQYLVQRELCDSRVHLRRNALRACISQNSQTSVKTAGDATDCIVSSRIRAVDADGHP